MSPSKEDDKHGKRRTQVQKTMVIVLCCLLVLIGIAFLVGRPQQQSRQQQPKASGEHAPIHHRPKEKSLDSLVSHFAQVNRPKDLDPIRARKYLRRRGAGLLQGHAKSDAADRLKLNGGGAIGGNDIMHHAVNDRAHAAAAALNRMGEGPFAHFGSTHGQQQHADRHEMAHDLEEKH